MVPGVVILQHVLAALAAERPGCSFIGITRVKFLRPLRPAQPFEIILERRSGGLIAFVCRCHEEVIARGQLLTDIAETIGA